MGKFDDFRHVLLITIGVTKNQDLLFEQKTHHYAWQVATCKLIMERTKKSIKAEI